MLPQPFWVRAAAALPFREFFQTPCACGSTTLLLYKGRVLHHLSLFPKTRKMHRDVNTQLRVHLLSPLFPCTRGYSSLALRKKRLVAGNFVSNSRHCSCLNFLPKFFSFINSLGIYTRIVSMNSDILVSRIFNSI
jgi:hypothetical protein